MVRRGKRTRTFGHVKQQARYEEAEPRHHAGARYSWRHFCPGVKCQDEVVDACVSSLLDGTCAEQGGKTADGGVSNKQA